ncbi:MAG: MBL fold metallo-hydrolase [Actinobacteria bacterium]|nr:MBL fold metallo-hydrolase [Actinomycetota bacterium]
MYFRQLLHDEHSCTSYVIGCVSLGAAAVVDPQGDVESYIKLTSLSGTRITHVIDTHVHADHYSGAAQLAQRAGVPLYLGQGAEVDFHYEGLHDGDFLQIGNRSIRVLHTPGHTPEHVSLLVDDWFVLTGDTLFVGDVGRVDLALAPTEDSELDRRARELHASLQALLKLPDHVEVYPGHYAGSVCGRGMDGKPSSTIGRERLRNQVLTLDADSFVEFQLRDVPPVPQDFHRIKEANRKAAATDVRS